MAKPENQPAQQESNLAQAPAEVIDLALDEFCVRVSVKDRRVELLAAFHAVERAAGRLKDTEQAFAARFSAFQTQPA